MELHVVLGERVEDVVYTDTWLVGVFSTPDAAERAIAEQPPGAGRYSTTVVQLDVPLP